jgi:tol-pal system protein YbgF
MRRAAAVVPALALLSSACFATRNDVRLLQSDVLAFRAEATRADTARARQLASVAAAMSAALGSLSDSLRETSARMDRLRGETRTELYSIEQQLLQVQELTGQSQRRINELRSELEQKNAQAQAPPVVAPPPAAGDTSKGVAAPVPAAPGPAQLYQVATQQLSQGSYATGRAGLQELLRLYPTSDLAPDAQYFIAESYEAEKNGLAADSAYSELLTKYPRSTRAPNALYKVALSLAKQGKRPEARAAMDRVAREYPQSDAAELAREWLRTNR